jgi:hypothetical protein
MLHEKTCSINALSHLHFTSNINKIQNVKKVTSLNDPFTVEIIFIKLANCDVV